MSDFRPPPTPTFGRFTNRLLAHEEEIVALKNRCSAVEAENAELKGEMAVLKKLIFKMKKWIKEEFEDIFGETEGPSSGTAGEGSIQDRDLSSQQGSSQMMREGEKDESQRSFHMMTPRIENFYSTTENVIDIEISDDDDETDQSCHVATSSSAFTSFQSFEAGNKRKAEGGRSTLANSSDSSGSAPVTKRTKNCERQENEHKNGTATEKQDSDSGMELEVEEPNNDHEVILPPIGLSSVLSVTVVKSPAQSTSKEQSKVPTHVESRSRQIKNEISSGSPNTCRPSTSASSDRNGRRNGNSQNTSCSEDDVPCEVCGNPDQEENNDIVFCDSCNVAVHQACYGIPTIPKGNWYCKPCKSKLNPNDIVCYFCGHKGGALARIISPKMDKWGHVHCSHWIAEVGLKKDNKMDIYGIDQPKFKDRLKLKCKLCPNPGSPIQCSFGKCLTAFHPYCAKKHDHLMFMSDTSTKLSRFVYCEQHRAKGEGVMKKCQETSTLVV